MDLQELTHSHAFEIVLQSIADCDRLEEALRENFQVIQYQDHIRRPLPGGNQSLLIKLKGEKQHYLLPFKPSSCVKLPVLG